MSSQWAGAGKLSLSLSLNRSLSLRDRSDTIIAQPHLGWLSCKWFVINIIRFNKFSQRESLLRPIFTYRSLLLTFPNVFDKILTPALHPETLKNESFFFLLSSFYLSWNLISIVWKFWFSLFLKSFPGNFFRKFFWTNSRARPK